MVKSIAIKVESLKYVYKYIYIYISCPSPDTTRSAACTYITSLLKRNLIQNFSQNMPQTEDSIFLYNCIVDENLENSFKQFFKNTLQSVLNVDSSI